MTIDLAGALVGQPTVAPAAAHKAVARTLRRGLLLMLTPAASAEDAASAGVAVAVTLAVEIADATYPCQRQGRRPHHV